METLPSSWQSYNKLMKMLIQLFIEEHVFIEMNQNY